MKSNRNHALILAAIHHFSGSCPSSYCTGPSQLISSLCLQLSASFLSCLQDNDRRSKWLMSTSARICLCAMPETSQSTAVPPSPAQCVCLDWPAMNPNDQQEQDSHTQQMCKFQVHTLKRQLVTGDNTEYLHLGRAGARWQQTDCRQGAE